MLKTIIRKLERKRKEKKKKNLKLERLQGFFYFYFFPFKLKRLTQNPKTELKRLWAGFDSGTK